MSSKIAITDYIDNPDIEYSILGDLVGYDIGEETQVLLVWHKQINANFLNKTPSLKGVQRYGVGYDNLDLGELKKQGVIACNNPDYGVDEVSDTTIAMIMNMVRGVAIYNNQAKSYYDNWQENVNTRLKRSSDVTVGVIGAGRIGGSVILKCNSLNINTIFYDKYKERGYEKLLSSERLDSLDELLHRSDIISVHVPLSNETRHLIDSKFIKNMKTGASLINTARGGLFSSLDELYEAMKNDKIFQLAADVLPEEPPLSGKLIDAWRKSESWINGRLMINPHTSYYSSRSIQEMRINAAKNALRMYKNETPHNIV